MHVKLLDNGNVYPFITKRSDCRDLSEKSVRGFTVLQKCVLSNLPSFVTALLNVGVNPNLYTVENPTRPVLLAAHRGHHQVSSVQGIHVWPC